MSFRLRWPTEYDGVTQRFGANPQFYRKFGLPGHEGLDFRAPEGSGIYAAAAGSVTEVRLDGNRDPARHPYGNQIRLQHAGGFATIYAHLSEVLVVEGQQVAAGERIGLAGNTGNSSGAHLHLTLKEAGATAAGRTTYPHDIIDPTPYLGPFAPPVEPEDPPAPTLEVQVHSPELGFLNVRQAPHTGAAQVGRVDHATRLGSLEAEVVTRQKVGQPGQWLRVLLPDDSWGYVAAWYLSLPGEPAPPPEPTTRLVVDSPQLPLKVRGGPGTQHPIRAEAPHGTQLEALDPLAEVERRVGVTGAWLHVRTPEGGVGYSAAWYLALAPQVERYDYVRVKSPGYGLRVRSGPGTGHEQVWWVPHGTLLEAREDSAAVQRKLGTQGKWLQVRTPARYEGYVAAWYLEAVTAPDTRRPVTAEQLSLGVSPHIFGMHLAQLEDDPGPAPRALFEDAGKPGWILFTQAIGRDPAGLHFDAGLRQRLWAWGEAGFGVIVRLNHGYEPAGTLPEADHYADFAATCARWVELYLRDDRPLSTRWTVIIANEQNNPSEHPGGLAAPREHITPALYAQAFNQAYARVKAVLPRAIVCPGAVDPYNSSPLPLLGNARWRPLDYFAEMLEGIEALDGFALHAYTHGPSVRAITHRETFRDPFLGDHYFDFQTYRLFMERIPAQWQQAPVYITESNHICRPPNAPACDNADHQGWVDANTGWVREAYAEIERWNAGPHRQQIRALLLYRWLGDRWLIRDKPGVIADFRQALEEDYRWRAPASVSVTAFAARGAMSRPALQVEERTLLAPDDFQAIRGIGPKTEPLLHAAGVVTYEQLACLGEGELRQLLGETGLQLRFVSTWPRQAGRLAEAHEL